MATEYKLKPYKSPGEAENVALAPGSNEAAGVAGNTGNTGGAAGVIGATGNPGDTGNTGGSGNTGAQPNKAYTMEELIAFQEEMSAKDKAEMQALGQTIYRRGQYTNTPSATTIRLAEPYDGMWYYDYGEKQYLNKWNEPTGSGVGQQTQTGNNGSAGTSSGIGSTTAGSNAAGGTSDLTSLLEEWKKAAAEQANGQIDYAVAQAITELERALEDAQPAFREQAEAVARDEAIALDNSALYAELRGDKGGIGQSQYNEIQAAAAQNRLAVQQAQTKLATDTARQIADLRAQGEFEKADKMLEITQTYLSQLISLEQWAAEFGFSQQQFQASLNQWQKEYELAMKKFGFEVESTENSRAAEIAYALLEQGIALTPEQLEALGMTDEQAAEWLSQQLGQPAGDEYEMTYSQAKSLLDSGVYSEKAAMIYEAYAGVPYDFTGHQGILKEHLRNPAVKTAKWNIDQGVWRGKALVETIEEAVGNKVISEEEAIALLKYAGLA